MARRPAANAGARTLAVLWYAVAIAMLLMAQFNLLIPRGILPLAHGYESAPLVFEAVYNSSNFIHSVGLLIAYIAFAGLFWAEARRTDAALSRKWALVGTVFWSVSVIVGVGLLIDRPPMPLAPVVMLSWLFAAALGLRLAFARTDARAAPTPDGHASERVA